MKKGLLVPLFTVLIIFSMSCKGKASEYNRLNNSASINVVEVEDTSEDEEVIQTAPETLVMDNLQIPGKNIGYKEYLETNFSSIEKLKFPLPEKYRYYISSEQGLRESIPNVNAGGGATLSTYHNAIDIAVPDKTPVYAAKSGYVQTVYPSYYNGDKWKGHPQYGGLIEIKHSDGTITLYAHLSFTEVREGSYVSTGDEIGWSGGKRGRRGSGNSTGPHLHFSEYIDIGTQFK